MKKLLCLVAGLSLLSATPLFALVGGPFDNGDYSQLLDESGIYQATFRFTNGQGFAQFGTNVDTTSFVDLTQSQGGTGGGTSSFRSSWGSYLDRSVIYYKGVTYLGTAWGTSDLANKEIHGITNGNSDIVTQQTNTSSSTQSNQQSAAATSTLIFNSGLGFTCNTSWQADITDTEPILKFNGSGELTVLNPSGQSLLYGATSQLIAALPQVATQNNASVTTIIAAINQLNGNGFNSLTADDINVSTAQSIQDDADQIQMTVYGERKFFISRQ